MVIIACLISNGYDVLACNSLDLFEKTPYMLPESSAESIEVGFCWRLPSFICC